MNTENIQIGSLYEYIGKYNSIIWLEKLSQDHLDLHQVKFGDLFVILKFQTVQPENQNFVICNCLFVKSGLIGGFVCSLSEIRLKEE